MWKQSLSLHPGENVELTMLTSDTMSILAMSMLMPTSTGAPVEQYDSKALVSIAASPLSIAC